ncbi:MAG: phosphoadenylyl-sulfate reductase, partial [Pararhodobacter sp.]
PLDATTRAEGLNARYGALSAERQLAGALADPALGKVALVSSFGADSVVLLHMVSQIAPETPVLFLDTLMLFPETLTYQREVAAKLGLTNVQVISASEAEIAAHDPDGTLNKTNPDACCDFRKTVPLERVLSGYDAWITGRKRFQNGQRAALEFFEPEPPARLRVNPLAHWRPEDVQDYMIENRLPRHPLV